MEEDIRVRVRKWMSFSVIVGDLVSIRCVHKSKVSAVVMSVCGEVSWNRGQSPLFSSS